MKRKIGFLVCLILVLFCTAALAADIKINEKNFPDPVFRDYVKQYDKNKDGKFSKEEIEKIYSITVDRKQIASLKGIEHFSQLSDLSCQFNQLKEINVSKNKNLTSLECDNNQLTKLDVSKNSKLVYLSLMYNQIRKLDASKNPVLKVLSCRNNQITELKLGKIESLKNLTCSGNHIQQLDVSMLSDLSFLNCTDNQLTKLDVSKNPLLEELQCEFNQLTELNLKNNPKLKAVDCCSNRIKLLDVTRCPILNELVLTTSPRYVSKYYRYGWWKFKDEMHYPEIRIVVDQNVKVTAKKTVAVKSIQLSNKKVKLKVGKTVQLSVKKISPVDATNKDVTWSSSDETVATVSDKGKVTGVGKGTCVITCTAADGSGVKAMCTIKVK